MSDTYAELILKKLVVEFDCHDSILWNQHEDGRLYAFANCNDLFFWGCADGEEILPEDIDEVVQAFKDSPYHGGLLWCARKRGLRPQGAYYKYLKDDASLFDACGPRRETGLGNPQDQDSAMQKPKPPVTKPFWKLW